MVEFELYDSEDDDFQSLLRKQKDILVEYFNAGKIISYTVTEDQSKAWAVMIAYTESELLNNIDGLPLMSYMDFQYYELMFYNTIQLIPETSLN
jgi:hypothetical protein